jgi:EAL domain-containing protein (putative c-di-GMP-specific phosphodiesterase class I)
VVRALVELGHALGLTVVAEGVESESQFAELRVLDCDDGQGFWFARPVSEDQVHGLLGPEARAPAGSSP